jgi:hypothetical protein
MEKGTGTPTTFVSVTFQLDAPPGVSFPLNPAQREALGTTASIKLLDSGIAYERRKFTDEEQADMAGMGMLHVKGVNTLRTGVVADKGDHTQKQKKNRNILAWRPPDHYTGTYKSTDAGLHGDVTRDALAQLCESGEVTVRFQIHETSLKLKKSLLQLELSVGSLSAVSSPIYVDSQAVKKRGVAETERASVLVRELKDKFGKLPNCAMTIGGMNLSTMFDQLVNCASLEQQEGA